MRYLLTRFISGSLIFMVIVMNLVGSRTQSVIMILLAFLSMTPTFYATVDYLIDKFFFRVWRKLGSHEYRLWLISIYRISSKAYREMRKPRKSMDSTRRMAARRISNDVARRYNTFTLLYGGEKTLPVELPVLGKKELKRKRNRGKI